jgi:hypothetical protein
MLPVTIYDLRRFIPHSTHARFDVDTYNLFITSILQFLSQSRSIWLVLLSNNSDPKTVRTNIMQFLSGNHNDTLIYITQ